MKRQRKGETTIPVSKWVPDSLFQTIQKTMPVACVDLIVLRKDKRGVLEALLIKRKIYPEEKKWCLIGGRILKDESTDETVNRQANGELGVSVKIIAPWTAEHPFAVYNDQVADKQKHFIALTFPVIITKGRLKKSGPEFSGTKWFPLDKMPKPLGFHHEQVMKMFSAHARTQPITV